MAALSSYSHYQSSLSAEIIANNEDLLTEILVCLPVKSLLSFKSVSKNWLSIITSPNFSLRLSRLPKPISGLLMPRNNSQGYNFINLGSNPSPAPFKSLTFEDIPSRIHIKQSCNGLLLCSSLQENARRPNYFVYNPATNKCTMLPPIANDNGALYRDVVLAFDPSKSPYYKVVCVKDCFNSESSIQIEVFSSQTRTWRVCNSSFNYPNGPFFMEGVFWNNAIYWCKSWSPSIYFDLDKEEVREIPMPPNVSELGEKWSWYLGASRGRLHLIEIYSPFNTIFNIYEMEKKEDFCRWVVKYQVDLSQIVTSYPEMIKNLQTDLDYYLFSTLCVVREENDDDSYLVVHLPGKIIRYNFKDKSFKKIHDFASSDSEHQGGSKNGNEQVTDFDFVGTSAFQYQESLASV
ncbi:F-box protein At5g07610-like [Mangifera indica]|uniref:F-box protein At5g07610-like n=1 Tax=Mangifera indica TaxID=29780 RepID=UPI001CFB2026|nr:F-box protein At5g07610-like [Mangifera indica]